MLADLSIPIRHTSQLLKHEAQSSETHLVNAPPKPCVSTSWVRPCRWTGYQLDSICPILLPSRSRCTMSHQALSLVLRNVGCFCRVHNIVESVHHPESIPRMLNHVSVDMTQIAKCDSQMQRLSSSPSHDCSGPDLQADAVHEKLLNH